MAIDFNQEEYIKQLKIHKRLEELKPKYNKEYYISSTDYISSLKEDIRIKEEELKKMSSFFKKIKYRSEIKRIKSEIEMHRSSLEQNIKKDNERKQNIEKMKEEINKLESQKKDISISDSISYDNKTIIISDSDEIPLGENASNDKVMIHCTNFFPKNKTILCDYDGNKKGIVDFEYNGINKKVESLCHRHTVHFTINSVVRTTEATRVAGGVWEQPKFIIIEPLEEHKKQFISGLDGFSDEFTYGSVKLGDKPLLLVREDSYDEIPKDEVDNYNVLKYKGNYISCVNNLLNLLGYKLTYGDANTAGHKYSDAGQTEEILDQRNLIINYVLDNSYDGKSDINFSISNLSEMYNIYKEDIKYYTNLIPYDSIYHYISEEIKIPVDFVNFCLNLGFYKDKDVIKMYDDDKMYNLRKCYHDYCDRYEVINNYREQCTSIKNCINYSQISDVYLDYLKYQKNILNNNDNKLIEEEQANTRHI